MAASMRMNAKSPKTEESHNQTDLRYIRRHPKHDRFPVRRLTLAAAALLIGVAMILLVALRSLWAI
jgi:hypothetical protein